MVFGVAEILEFVTAVMTLRPGDLILTCTSAVSTPIGRGRRLAHAYGVKPWSTTTAWHSSSQANRQRGRSP